MLPGAIIGVLLASALFISESNALIAISDKILKLSIGLVGLLFVLYFMGRKWILARLDEAMTPGWITGSSFGMIAGITSSLAHAAGPLMQMYLLPQHLPKMRFAATVTVHGAVEQKWRSSASVYFTRSWILASGC